jgi:hypothetical protein
LEKQEAAQIIRQLAQSVRANPNQFNITINAKAVGQSVVSNGGIGMVVNATGGAPGSSVIGNKVSVSSVDLEFANGAAVQGMEQQLHGLVGVLDEIAQNLESPKPDNGHIENLVDSISGKWVPAMIPAVIQAVTSLLS